MPSANSFVHLSKGILRPPNITLEWPTSFLVFTPQGNATRPRLEIGILIIGYEVRTEECRAITEIISSKS